MAYDPVGALNGLFAPAYIAGNPQADAAVQAWTVAHPHSPGVNTFVPDATAAATPVAANPQRDAIAQTIVQQQQPASTGYTPKYLPGGGLDPNDPGNIAQYYRLMGGGGGGAVAAPAPTAPAYNPADAWNAAANSGVTGGYIAPPPYEPWVNAS